MTARVQAATALDALDGQLGGRDGDRSCTSRWVSHRSMRCMPPCQGSSSSKSQEAMAGMSVPHRSARI